MPVGAQQGCGDVQFVEFRCGVDDVVDAVGPAPCREPAGLVEEEAAAGARQLVEAAAAESYVAQAAAGEGGRRRGRSGPRRR
ncbi:hypothetical protein OIM90_17380 [Streptomyces sp. AD16]|nr:hypothetical protein OIM90_17380 [Streptomyces sp. AD16]